MPSLPAHIGRYEIVDRLGEGGMGVVYLAHDPQLQRTVAIKMLSAQGDSEYHQELRQRFAREASAVAALKHNHIVTIYDVGEDAGRPFIAMEFLDGESMAQVIQRGAPLDVEYKVRLALELCAGLGYAHRRGIIHRDIKPANLMISGEGVLKILDFGLARVTASVAHADLTQAGALMGTPHYMSPEQVMGKPVDQRSDIFAVGAVLYELFTYRKAFQAPSQTLVLVQIMNAVPTPMRDLVPSLDEGLEQVIAKAIDKDPERRYQTLDALAADLKQVFQRPNAVLSGATIRIPALGQGAIVTTAGGGSAPGPGAAVLPPNGASFGATLVVPAGAHVKPAELPSRPSATRRPQVVALAVLAAAICAVVLYAAITRARAPQGAAGSATPLAGAPPATGASETTRSSPAAQPVERVPEAAPPKPPVTEPTPVAATPAVAPQPQPPSDSAPAVTGKGAVLESAGASKAPALEAAPAAAPSKTLPAGRGAPKSAEVDARCKSLLLQASLSEGLTAAERDFLAQQCRN